MSSLTGHQVQAGRRPGPGRGAGVTRQQEGHRQGEAERPPADQGALRPAAEEGETRRQACGPAEVLMGKAGKKLPTAMETSQKD